MTKVRLWESPMYMRHLYVTRKMSVQDMANDLGCHVNTVEKWLRIHKLKRSF